MKSILNAAGRIDWVDQALSIIGQKNNLPKIRIKENYCQDRHILIIKLDQLQ